MTEPDQYALVQLTAAGYFEHLPDKQPGQAVLDDVDARGLHAALFDYAPDTGRYIPLDAEDLAEGGAGMAIQQVKLLLQQRGIAMEAADSDTYDADADLTYLTINGRAVTLCKWSWGEMSPDEKPRRITGEAALQDLLWKFKAQGIQLHVAPTSAFDAEGCDLYLAWEDEKRFLHRWRFGTDDGWMLYAVGFFSIVNRLLEESGSPERMVAYRPFTNEQAGIFLTRELHALLENLDLGRHLRRIDTVRS